MAARDVLGTARNTHALLGIQFGEEYNSAMIIDFVQTLCLSDITTPLIPNFYHLFISFSTISKTFA